MTIATVLAAAAKHISWEQVADIAMKYGPDLLRKLKDQLQAGSGEELGAAVTVEQLAARVHELEGALVRQEEVMEQQARSIELLEEIGKTLQARLNIFMVLTAISLAASLVLGFLLLKR